MFTCIPVSRILGVSRILVESLKRMEATLATSVDIRKHVYEAEHFISIK
jgi:hypothetical protein